MFELRLSFTLLQSLMIGIMLQKFYDKWDFNGVIFLLENIICLCMLIYYGGSQLFSVFCSIYLFIKGD